MVCCWIFFNISSIFWPGGNTVWPLLFFQESHILSFQGSNKNFNLKLVSFLVFKSFFKTIVSQTIQFHPYCPFEDLKKKFYSYCTLQLLWWFSWKLSFWLHLCLLSNFVQNTIQFNLCNSVFEEDFEYFLYWNLILTLHIIQVPLYVLLYSMAWLRETFGNINVEETALLDGQLLEILPCNLIS